MSVYLWLGFVWVGVFSRTLDRWDKHSISACLRVCFGFWHRALLCSSSPASASRILDYRCIPPHLALFFFFFFLVLIFNDSESQNFEKSWGFLNSDSQTLCVCQTTRPRSNNQKATNCINYAELFSYISQY